MTLCDDVAVPRLFFWLVVRPVVLVVLGLNVRHRERLPEDGPALLVANHNSHLDTVVLMTLLPTRLLPKIRPVAAADYFLQRAARLVRPADHRHPADASGRAEGEAGPRRAGARPARQGLGGAGARRDRDPVPRGLAGGAGAAGRAQERDRPPGGAAIPEVPVVPVFLHGLGKTLPRGEVLPVPFFCDVFVGEPVSWTATPRALHGGAQGADAGARRRGAPDRVGVILAAAALWGLAEATVFFLVPDVLLTALGSRSTTADVRSAPVLRRSRAPCWAGRCCSRGERATRRRRGRSSTGCPRSRAG